MRKISNLQFPVTWLLAIVLIFTTWHILAFALRISEWNYLLSLQLTLSPIVMILISFIWALLGSVIALGIVYKKSWAIKLIWSGLILLGFAQVLTAIFFTDAGGIASLSILIIGIWLSVIGLFIWALSQERMKAHFGVHNER